MVEICVTENYPIQMTRNKRVRLAVENVLRRGVEVDVGIDRVIVSTRFGETFIATLPPVAVRYVGEAAADWESPLRFKIDLPERYLAEEVAAMTH